MQRYIEQIIEDLQNAKKNVKVEPDFAKMDYPEFEEKMLEIEESPNIPCKKIFGVSYEELPPPDKLTDNQMNQLIDAIADMWAEFGIDAIYPKGISLKLKYDLVKDTFVDDFHYMPGWQLTHDFCIGYCPDCKIFDLCENRIDDWDNFDPEFDVKIKDDDELPF